MTVLSSYAPFGYHEWYAPPPPPQHGETRCRPFRLPLVRPSRSVDAGAKRSTHLVAAHPLSLVQPSLWGTSFFDRHRASAFRVVTDTAAVSTRFDGGLSAEEGMVSRRKKTWSAGVLLTSSPAQRLPAICCALEMGEGTSVGNPVEAMALVNILFLALSQILVPMWRSFRPGASSFL